MFDAAGHPATPSSSSPTAPPDRELRLRQVRAHDPEIPDRANPVLPTYGERIADRGRSLRGVDVFVVPGLRPPSRGCRFLGAVRSCPTERVLVRHLINPRNAGVPGSGRHHFGAVWQPPATTEPPLDDRSSTSR